jgi:regulator of sigma E protease
MALTPKRMDLPRAEGGFETRWLIGVNGGLFFTPQTETPGVVEALGYGVDQVVFVIRSSLSGLYHMAIGAISTCNLRGPIGIAEVSGDGGQPGLDQLHLVHRGPVDGGGVPEPASDPDPRRRASVFHAWEALTGRRRATGFSG